MDTEADSAAKWKERAYRVWAIIGICILAAGIVYVCGIIWQAVTVIIITSLAVFLLHGAVNVMEEHGIARAVGTIICIVVLSAIIIGCFFAFIPAVISQLTSFSVNLSDYITKVQDFLRDNAHLLGAGADAMLNEAVDDAAAWVRTQSGSLVSSMAGGVVGSVISVSNALVIAFISLVCSIWILIDLPKISVEVRKLFRDDMQDDIDIITDAFGSAVYGWAKSTLICAVITGVVSGIAFWICGIPYSGVLAFICGVLYLVPYIGPMVSCAIVAVIALFVSVPVCIISIVINVVINNVIGNIVSPRLMKSSVSVHPALILIAIMVGSAVAGLAGMLLSIPVIGAMQGVFVTYFEARTGKTLATEDGALFQKKKEAKLPSLNTGKWHMPKSGGK